MDSEAINRKENEFKYILQQQIQSNKEPSINKRYVYNSQLCESLQINPPQFQQKNVLLIKNVGQHKLPSTKNFQNQKHIIQCCSFIQFKCHFIIFQTMEFSCIFPTEFNAGISSYVLGTLLGSTFLYYAVHFFNLRRIIDNLYSLASHHEIIDRTYFHYLIVMFPFLIVIFISIFYNHSLIGIEISMNVDEISIFMATAYIYWVDQTRQTPIRGFIFMRDNLFLLGSFSIFFYVYYSGQTNIYEGIVFIFYFFIYYLFQNLSNKIEDLLLRAFGLKERKIYTTKELLAKKKQLISPDIIKDIIANNTEQIKLEIEQFQNMADTIVQERHERRIIINFSKIFVAIRKAKQLHQRNQLKEALQKQRELWNEGQIEEHQQSQKDQIQQVIEDKELNHEEFEKESLKRSQQSMENSMDGIQKDINKQYSASNDSAVDIIRYENQQDYIIEKDEDDAKENTIFMKMLKCMCFPIYLISLPEGRLRHFFDYVSFFIMIGCMFLITNSACYFSYNMNQNFSIIGLATAILIGYPTISYYTQLCKIDNYDFMNIFIEAGIFKLFIGSLTLSISSFIIGFSVEDGINHLIILIFRAITYLILAIFIIVKKFKVQSSFYRFFVGLLIISQISRMIIELSLGQL